LRVVIEHSANVIDICAIFTVDYAAASAGFRLRYAAILISRLITVMLLLICHYYLPCRVISLHERHDALPFYYVAIVDIFAAAPPMMPRRRLLAARRFRHATRLFADMAIFSPPYAFDAYCHFH